MVLLISDLSVEMHTSNLTPQNLSAIIIMITILRGINLLALFKDEETAVGWHNPVTLVPKS